MKQKSVLAALMSSLVTVLAVHGCASSPPPDGERQPAPALGEIEQHADGCGAGRYSGSANIDCNYQGQLTGDIAATGTCLNDSQISCTFTASCQWVLSQVITACVDGGAATCQSSYPPEGSPPSYFATVTGNLKIGSTLCDPPGSAAALASYCLNQVYVSGSATSGCASQTDRNEGSTTCCLNCPMGPPAPGRGALLAADLVIAEPLPAVCAIAE